MPLGSTKRVDSTPAIDRFLARFRKKRGVGGEETQILQELLEQDRGNLIRDIQRLLENQKSSEHLPIPAVTPLQPAYCTIGTQTDLVDDVKSLCTIGTQTDSVDDVKGVEKEEVKEEGAKEVHVKEEDAKEEEVRAGEAEYEVAASGQIPKVATSVSAASSDSTSQSTVDKTRAEDIPQPEVRRSRCAICKWQPMPLFSDSYVTCPSAQESFPLVVRSVCQSCGWSSSRFLAACVSEVGGGLVKPERGIRRSEKISVAPRTGATVFFRTAMVPFATPSGVTKSVPVRLPPARLGPDPKPVGHAPVVVALGGPQHVKQEEQDVAEEQDAAEGQQAKNEDVEQDRAVSYDENESQEEKDENQVREQQTLMVEEEEEEEEEDLPAVEVAAAAAAAAAAEPLMKEAADITEMRFLLRNLAVDMSADGDKTDQLDSLGQSSGQDANAGAKACSLLQLEEFNPIYTNAAFYHTLYKTLQDSRT